LECRERIERKGVGKLLQPYPYMIARRPRLVFPFGVRYKNTEGSRRKSQARKKKGRGLSMPVARKEIRRPESRHHGKSNHKGGAGEKGDRSENGKGKGRLVAE